MAAVHKRHRDLELGLRSARLKRPFRHRDREALAVLLVTPALQQENILFRLEQEIGEIIVDDRLIVVTNGTTWNADWPFVRDVIALDDWDGSPDAKPIRRLETAIVVSTDHVPFGPGPHAVREAMLGKVADLPISRRTRNLIANDNIIYIGDLVQKTEAELLRMPDFGRKALNEIKVVLAGIYLRLGMDLDDWPPVNIEEATRQLEAARRAANLRQARGGATFEPTGDRFAMSSDGDDDDLAAGQKPMTRQMQEALVQKARSFADVAARLDNQPGWTGIGRAAAHLAELLDRAPEEIPDVLGYLYPATIEMGSFVELDQQLTASTDAYAAPLDPEVRRPLTDLVRNLAPWLRAFPSAREMDDEANRFLVQAATLRPTFDVVRAAGDHALLSEADLEVFRQLRDAAERGAFQGEKAGGRAKRSASNLVIGVVAFAGSIFTGAVASDVATTSPLVHKVGQFLVQQEKTIEALVADLPHDLRFSITDFVRELPNQPAVPPTAPEPADRLRAPFSASDRPYGYRKV